MKKVTNVPNLRFPGFEGEWNREKIGHILTIGSGKDYKHLSEGTIPVFGTGGYMTSVDDFLYEGESVCIGRKGTINKPSYFNGKFWTVDTLFYTHSFKNILPKFVYNIFEQINWLKYNEASGVPSLSKSTIEQIDINIPCVDEQQKIATFLSLIDERIQTQNKIIEELGVLKSAMAKKIFSQKLRFKVDNQENFFIWKERKLGEIAVKKSSNISANSLEENHGEYKVYGASGLLKLIDFYKEIEPYIAIVKDGAGVGKLFLCEEKSSVLGTLDILKNKEMSDLKFLYYLLSTLDFSKFMTGSTIPHIYFKDYSNEIIGLPAHEEQQKIASFLSTIDTKIDTETQLLQKLEEQKRFLLQQMFV
ncbi:MAG: restriction endonuclease subunit S [Bacteroidetes bacterium]|nr:restriction endonuclease subunit S [Bacteroidota bacterium]